MTALTSIAIFLSMDLKTYCKDIETQTSLAGRMGVTQGLVWQWIEGVTRITAERAIQIERVTGGQVGKHELRPDVFDAPLTPVGAES